MSGRAEALRTAPIAVFWDIENCGIPRAGAGPVAIVGRIASALRDRDLFGSLSITAYGDSDGVPRAHRSDLAQTGINLVSIPSGRKDVADKALLVDMLIWALDQGSPASILLISGDADYAGALNKLKMRGFNLLVSYPKSQRVGAALTAAATYVLDWSDLAGSLPTSSSHLSLFASSPTPSPRVTIDVSGQGRTVDLSSPATAPGTPSPGGSEGSRGGGGATRGAALPAAASVGASRPRLGSRFILDAIAKLEDEHILPTVTNLKKHSMMIIRREGGGKASISSDEIEVSIQSACRARAVKLVSSSFVGGGEEALVPVGRTTSVRGVDPNGPDTYPVGLWPAMAAHLKHIATTADLTDVRGRYGFAQYLRDTCRKMARPHAGPAALAMLENRPIGELVHITQLALKRGWMRISNKSDVFILPERIEAEMPSSRATEEVFQRLDELLASPEVQEAMGTPDGFKTKFRRDYGYVLEWQAHGFASLTDMLSSDRIRSDIQILTSIGGHKVLYRTGYQPPAGKTRSAGTRGGAGVGARPPSPTSHYHLPNPSVKAAPLPAPPPAGHGAEPASCNSSSPASDPEDGFWDAPVQPYWQGRRFQDILMGHHVEPADPTAQGEATRGGTRRARPISPPAPIAIPSLTGELIDKGPIHRALGPPSPSSLPPPCSVGGGGDGMGGLTKPPPLSPIGSRRRLRPAPSTDSAASQSPPGSFAWCLSSTAPLPAVGEVRGLAMHGPGLSVTQNPAPPAPTIEGLGEAALKAMETIGIGCGGITSSPQSLGPGPTGPEGVGLPTPSFFQRRDLPQLPGDLESDLFALGQAHLEEEGALPQDLLD